MTIWSHFTSSFTLYFLHLNSSSVFFLFSTHTFYCIVLFGLLRISYIVFMYFIIEVFRGNFTNFLDNSRSCRRTVMKFLDGWDVSLLYRVRCKACAGSAAWVEVYRVRCKARAGSPAWVEVCDLRVLPVASTIASESVH